MYNLHLDSRTAQDIADRVARVHREIDYKQGAIDLASIREALRLDLNYYRADDPGVWNEVVHALRVGAKQVLARPELLVEAVKKFDLKALLIPDKKRILIDASLPDLKKRWSEGHEISHSLIPWHSDYMFGDTRATLSPACHERIEAEANYGTGRLIFPNKLFEELRLSQPTNLAQIRRIAEYFGNTITSTLWRCVENDELPSFAIIGDHPRRPREGKEIVEYLVRSRMFENQFSKFERSGAATCLASYCGYSKAGPLGQGEILISDDTGVEHLFHAETFSITHSSLTLAQYLRPAKVQVSTIGFEPAKIF